MRNSEYSNNKKPVFYKAVCQSYNPNYNNARNHNMSYNHSVQNYKDSV